MQFAPLSFDDNNSHGDQAHHDETATVYAAAKPRAEDDYSPSDSSDWSPPAARPPPELPSLARPVTPPRAKDGYEELFRGWIGPKPVVPPDPRELKWFERRVARARPAKHVPPGLRKDLGWEREPGRPLEGWEMEDPVNEEMGWGPGFLDKFKDASMPKVVRQMNDAFLASRARCVEILKLRLLLKHNPREYEARMEREQAEKAARKAASQKKWAAGGGEGHDSDHSPERPRKRKSVARKQWYKAARSAPAAPEQPRAAPPPQYVPSDSPSDSE